METLMPKNHSYQFVWLLKGEQFTKIHDEKLYNSHFNTDNYPKCQFLRENIPDVKLKTVGACQFKSRWTTLIRTAG